MGRTGLSADTPEINSENLLAVLAPIVFLFGVSLFFVLLEQFGLALPALWFWPEHLLPWRLLWGSQFLAVPSPWERQVPAPGRRMPSPEIHGA